MIDLDNITKEEHYQVPDGYFDEFPKQVMYSIRKENAKRRNIWLTSIAAVMALVICSITIVRYMLNNEKEKEQMRMISVQTEQLEEQMVDYYSAELAQMDYLYY
jgi:hypothetical protein